MSIDNLLERKFQILGYLYFLLLPTIDRTLPDISRPDRERTSGPAQVARAVPAPGNVPSPAVFPRRRTPVLRPLPLNIVVIISHRAIVDPCHQLHIGRIQITSHRPVIMRVVKPSEKRTIIVISSPARQVHVESAPEVQVPAPVTDGPADHRPATVQVPAPVADGARQVPTWRQVTARTQVTARP